MNAGPGWPGGPRLAAWAAFAAAVAWTFWAGLVPVSSLPQVSLWDKAAHALNYALLAALLWFATGGRRPWLAGLGLVLLGGLVEIGQALSGTRTGDWQDALANATGILGVTALLVAARRLRRR